MLALLLFRNLHNCITNKHDIEIVDSLGFACSRHHRESVRDGESAEIVHACLMDCILIEICSFTRVNKCEHVVEGV